MMASHTLPPNPSQSADEHSPLLDHSQHQQPEQQQRRPHSTPHLSLPLGLCFLSGIVILLVTVFFLLVLLVNLFQPIPLLLPPHRSTALFPIWACVLSILLVAPALFFFQPSSKPTLVAHSLILFFSTCHLLLLVSLQEFRSTHGWLGALSVVVILLSCVWATSTSKLLAKAQVEQQRPLSKWTCSPCQTLLAVCGSVITVLIAALLTFNTLLDASDAQLTPIGNLTLIDLPSSVIHGNDPANTNPYSTLFRLHLTCERSPSHPGHESTPFDQPSNTTEPRPTALVMTERGVAGVTGSQWLREMVSQAGRPDYGHGDNDGHFALESVCFWDRIGYAHTNFVNQPFSIRLHTEALYKALVASQQIDPNRPIIDSDNQTHRPFMLVSTGYGNLFAQDFAIRYPHLIHSFLFIDAETPQSWYTETVSLSSGLRAGYLAAGHGRITSIYNDLLPALLEPLGFTRLSGLLLGNSAIDRILAPRDLRFDLAGGGWHWKRAGGSHEGLLLTSWYERLDANLGIRSFNFQSLHHSSTKFTLLLSNRPVAVLSSFWKIHSDVNGWTRQQLHTLIDPAKQSGNLVGWWRIGDRLGNPTGGFGEGRGGDQGDPAGICSNHSLGMVFCQQAVRKLLAAA